MIEQRECYRNTHVPMDVIGTFVGYVGADEKAYARDCDLSSLLKK